MTTRPDLEALAAAMKADCNEHVNGRCYTLACFKRGGYQGFGPATDFTPTCQAKQVLSLIDECSRLRADGATLKARADEALAAHSASFGALATLSAILFDGHAGDYDALADKVIARVKQAEADGATLRERVKEALTDAWMATVLNARADVRDAAFEAVRVEEGELMTVDECEKARLDGYAAMRQTILDALDPLFPASAPKAPTPHVHTTMGATGPCSICGVQVRCRHLEAGQNRCDLPNVHCVHPQCLQSKEPTPR